MTPLEVAARLDHAILKPGALSPEVHRVATEALQGSFASVIVAPLWVKRVATMLQGSGVPVATVVGFPLGGSKPTVKAIEATSSIKDGAAQIDVVPYPGHFVALDVDAARTELMEIVRAARATRRETIITAMIELSSLQAGPPERIEKSIATACRAIRESGCDFIKIGTGFSPAGGATVELLALVKRHADSIGIKATADISDWLGIRLLFDAGAERIQPANALAVLESFKSIAAR